MECGTPQCLDDVTQDHYCIPLGQLLFGDDWMLRGCTLCDGPGAVGVPGKPAPNNVWVENNICLLNYLTLEGLEYSLMRSVRNQKDFATVTTNCFLLDFAASLGVLSANNFTDQMMSNLNGLSIPYYRQFKGNPNGQ